MLQEKKLNTNIGVFVGLVLLSCTQFLLHSHYISPTVSLILGWIAIMALCWGIMQREKDILNGTDYLAF